MIIASPILSFKRMADTYRENYSRQNKTYESCVGSKPSAKIRAKYAAKAIGFAVAAEIAKLSII